MAGAGKTALLAAVARSASAEGMQVIRLLCHESDRDLPYGVLTDLLRPAVGAGTALELISPGSASAAVDPLRLRLEVLSWLEQVSEDLETVVVVDDAHWCDDSSLSVLAFVSNRLSGSKASVIFAARDRAPMPLSRHAHIELPPLSDDQSRILLRRAGLRVDALDLPRVIERAAGIPLALLELGRAASTSEWLTVPSDVEGAFRAQVAALPASAREALLLAAVNDGDAEVTLLGRVLGDHLLSSLEPAERADLITIDRAVIFRHPLIRSACVAVASSDERRRAHAVLADAYQHDANRSAWHRGEATLRPDEEVASALVSAFDDAYMRGATAEAVRFMVRASELSPDQGDRDARLLQAVEIAGKAGNYEWLIATGTQLASGAEDPAIRLRASHNVAYALTQLDRSSQARRQLNQLLQQLIDVDLDYAWASLTTLTGLTYRAGWETDEVAGWLARLRQRAANQDPGSLAELNAAADAWVAVSVNPLEPPPGALELVRSTPLPDYPASLLASHEMLLGAAAWLLEEPVVALERLKRASDIMIRTDALGEMTQTLLGLAMVHFAVADYDAADEAGRMVFDIAEARNQRAALVDSYDLQARVAAVRGDVGRAQALCDRVLLEAPAGQDAGFTLKTSTAMSWVRLAEHDMVGAWTEISAIFDEAGAPRHPHISYRELGYYAAIAARVGASEALRDVVTQAEHRLKNGRPFHHFQLNRARAHLDIDNAEQWHLAALREPTAGQRPFELAGAQLDYGTWLRRRHRQTDARPYLHWAHATFTRLGAKAWAELAGAELRAAGATPGVDNPAWNNLTAQERQVVRLAASGMTNPEIATALFLSPRTVSTHLYNAFPKLGVSSRAQLRDLVPG
ncbi:LuxR family transcriptional regulator [Nocardioides aestuarii]